MTDPQHRTNAPAFLTGHDQTIAFIGQHRSNHQPTRGGACSCGWTKPAIARDSYTQADHANADLAQSLAERLPTGWTDTDRTIFNWPDLAEHVSAQLDAAHAQIDTYQFHLGQLFEVSQTMKQAAKTVDDLIADRDAEGAYLVAIHRSGTMWEIHVAGVGVTQAEGPNGFEAMARDYLGALGRNENARLDVTWHHDGTTEYLTWEAKVGLTVKP